MECPEEPQTQFTVSPTLIASEDGLKVRFPEGATVTVKVVAPADAARANAAAARRIARRNDIEPGFIDPAFPRAVDPARFSRTLHDSRKDGALAAGRQDRRISRNAAPTSAEPSTASIPAVSVGTAGPTPDHRIRAPEAPWLEIAWARAPGLLGRSGSRSGSLGGFQSAPLISEHQFPGAATRGAQAPPRGDLP